MKKLLMLCFVVSLMLCGCSVFRSTNLNNTTITTSDKTTQSTTKTITTITKEKETLSPIKPTGNIASGKDYYDELDTINLYEDLFNLNNKISIGIDIDNKELEKINNDYMRNTYRKANSITITILYPNGNSISKTLNEVGIRMKGNTSRHSFYDNGNIYSNVHYKLSFQETFDDKEEYNNNEIKNWDIEEDRNNRKNRTFFGLGGIELKYNKECDFTYSRDIYAHQIYRENGIYAQNISLSKISFMNQNTSDGLESIYKIYEPVDRIFIKRYFNEDNNDGDLYKATWGKNYGMPTLNHTESGYYGVNNSIYKNDKYVTLDLKTNKKTSDQSMIKDFLKWINSSSKDLSSTVNNYMNEEYFYTFMAIQYLTGDWDNFLYDSNNYYLYFGNDGKAYFIPYDMDRTFGIQSKSRGMIEKRIDDKWNLQGDDNLSNLLKKTIFIGEGKKTYQEKAKEIALNILDIQKFRKLYSLIDNNYHKDIHYITYEDDIDDNNSPYDYFRNKLKTLN